MGEWLWAQDWFLIFAWWCFEHTMWLLGAGGAGLLLVAVTLPVLARAGRATVPVDGVEDTVAFAPGLARSE